jgi:hypothetical protein
MLLSVKFMIFKRILVGDKITKTVNRTLSSGNS